MQKSSKMKRLRLSSETLLRLDQNNLRQLGGGATTYVCFTITDGLGCSCHNCNTHGTCTTRWC